MEHVYSRGLEEVHVGRAKFLLCIGNVLKLKLRSFKHVCFSDHSREALEYFSTSA